MNRATSLLIMLFAAALFWLLPVQAQTPQCNLEYTVQAGDWLSKIAEKYFGNSIAFDQIVTANNADASDSYVNIDNPDLIKPGWLLCIPASIQAAEPTGEVAQVEANPLSPADVTFDAQDLSQNIVGVVVEEQPYDNTQPADPMGHPQHVAFQFDGEVRLRVYPIKAYESQWQVAGDPAISTAANQLRALLSTRPNPPEAPLPILPPQAGFNDIAVQSQYFDFANGSGIRFVGRVSQDASPVLGRQLRTYFQGLTSDGQYLVYFSYPVTIPTIIPNDIGTLPQDVAQVAAEDFNRYLTATKDALQAASPADFNPSLSTLDALIQSINIEGTATVPSAADIVGPVWKWQETLDNSGNIIIPDNPNSYTLQLKPDGTVVIQADCNSGSGTHATSDTSISIEIQTTTLVACPPGSLEQLFISDIGAATIWFIRNGSLFLDLMADGGTMKFAR